MKRLLLAIASLASALVMTASASAATPHSWKVDIYQPQATTNKTLSVEYKVLSVVSTDTFTVELFENGTTKGTQAVTHPYGNSGVFTFTLPAAGTYSYKVTATNHGDGDATKDSATVSVAVSDAPEPTVTTVFVNNGTTAATGGQGGGGSTAGATASSATADTTTGQVSDAAATTTTPSGTDVLGAETKANQANRTRRNWYAAGLGVLAAAGAGYYIIRRRLNEN